MALPPGENETYPQGPEIEERKLGYCDALDIDRQRKASGGLQDEPSDDPVRNSTPFRNLRSV